MAEELRKRVMYEMNHRYDEKNQELLNRAQLQTNRIKIVSVLPQDLSPYHRYMIGYEFKRAGNEEPFMIYQTFNFPIFGELNISENDLIDSHFSSILETLRQMYTVGNS